MGYAVQSLGTWKSWTPTFTGFSSDPTSVVFRYVLIGKVCHYWFTMGDGTSNATTFTMTMPFVAASNGQNQFHILSTIVNNGSIPTNAGKIQITVGTNVATLLRDLSGTAWTASGAKRAFGSGSYEIA